MKLVTLGGLELLGTAFARPKPLLLLAYVALEGPRDRRYLAELFWPEATDPLNSLSAALKQLRHDAPGLVESDSTQTWTHIACDAKGFLEAAEAGQHESVLELYSGPFLSAALERRTRGVGLQHPRGSRGLCPPRAAPSSRG